MFGGAFGPPFAFSSPIFLASQCTPPPPLPQLKLQGWTHIYVCFAAEPKKKKEANPNIYVLLQEAEFKT